MNTIEKALLKEKQAQKAKQDLALDESLNKTEATEATEATNNINTAKQVTNSHKQKIEIDIDSLEQKGFVSTQDSRSIINEQYRAIKRKLLETAFGKLSNTLHNSNIIMVTSSKPGEGKTFTAVNLAMSIALEKDKTVLLVDADVLKPNVMKTLGLKNSDGLMEFLLEEEKDIANVMLKTNIEKLSVIPAGRSHHLSTELLASENMQDIMNEFANRYSDRVVIVDSPPLLGINETAILANLAGQAVVVAEEGKTKLVELKKAVAQLNPELAVGFVINKSQKSKEDDDFYGYYYGGDN